VKKRKRWRKKEWMAVTGAEKKRSSIKAAKKKGAGEKKPLLNGEESLDLSTWGGE